MSLWAAHFRFSLIYWKWSWTDAPPSNISCCMVQIMVISKDPGLLHQQDGSLNLESEMKPFSMGRGLQTWLTSLTNLSLYHIIILPKQIDGHQRKIIYLVESTGWYFLCHLNLSHYCKLRWNSNSFKYRPTALEWTAFIHLTNSLERSCLCRGTSISSKLLQSALLTVICKSFKATWTKIHTISFLTSQMMPEKPQQYELNNIKTTHHIWEEGLHLSPVR